jgi:tetratricopeptide (TPR) repeat protein
MSERALHRVLALLVFLIPLTVYVMTMAATTSFWDSGEFIASAFILGIPHSPGTPLYVLVGRVFTMLPLPLSSAARVNFFSVLCGALAVLMGFLIMVRTMRFMYPAGKGGLGQFMVYAGAFVGSLYLTFSDTFWRDATEAEVYSLSAFLMGLCTWLALEWYGNPAGHAKAAVQQAFRGVPGRDTRADAEQALDREERSERSHARGLVYLIVYLLALGIGFHLGTVLVYGGIFLLFLLVKDKAFGNGELIVFTVGFAVLLADITMHRSSGVTIAGLVIFAAAVAWSTMTKGRFALAATGLLVLGVSVHLYMYIRSHLDPGIDMVDPQTWKAMYAHLRREQYPPMNIFERKASFAFQIAHFGRYFRDQFQMFGDSRLGSFNLGAAATAIPAALGLLGIAANFGRERKTWVLNFMNLFINSLGLIVFLNFSSSEVRERDYFYGGAFYFFAVFVGIGATSLLITLAENVKSRGREAYTVVVPVGVLLLCASILPGHHNWFSHNRSHHYIAQEYGYNVLASLEPDAIVFTYGDNDTYPLWYIQNVEHFRTDVRVANLSLLNTGWYIKQLRDREPKVPIAMSDDDIEQLRPIELKDGGIAWINDLMVQHIIKTSDWKRPIYFATTVAPEDWIPYENYLEMQGMVRRLVPVNGKSMRNAFLIERNFGELFRFHGILTKDWRVDDSLYKEKDLNVILGNYAVAVYELAQLKWKEQDYAGAARWAERALCFDPKLKPAKIVLGVFYALNNEQQKAIDYYTTMVRKEPKEGEYWLRLAWVFSLQGNFPAALQTIDEGIRNAPDQGQLYVDGFRYASETGDMDFARRYLTRWLEKHPEDEEFRRAYEDVERSLREEQGASPGRPGAGAKHGR